MNKYVIVEYLLVADIVIKVEFKLNRETDDLHNTDNYFHKLVRDYYKGFIIEEIGERKVDFTIVLEPRIRIDIVQNQRHRKRYLLFYQHISTKKVRSSYDIGIIQFSLLLREVIQKLLPKRSGFILHGSAVAYLGNGVVFSGKSGSGKSTLVKILNQSTKSLADDMVIIRKIKKEWYVFQTPFFEKNYLFARTADKHRLKAILTPKKSDRYEIRNKFNQGQKFRLLTAQLFSEEESIREQVKVIQQLSASKRIEFGEIFFSLKSREKVVELIEKYAYLA